MSRQSDRYRATTTKTSTTKKLDKKTILQALTKEDNTNKLLRISTEFIEVTSNIRSTIEKNDNFIALRESIKDYGLLHPIVVSKVDRKISVVSGHRRLQAAKELNLPEIPVILKVFQDERDRTVEQVIENVVRENLSPIDFAEAIHEIKSMEKVSASKIATFIGQKDRKYVERLCKVAKWDKKAKKLAQQLNLSLFQLMNIAKKSDAKGPQLLEYLNGQNSLRQGATAFDSKTEKKIDRWLGKADMPKREQSKFKSVAKVFNNLTPDGRERLKDFLENVW